jgi:ribosome-associated toxin RatA of RatAB toxin-antitoxin module
MYRLVHDVPRYPEFLSWCTRTEVLEQTADLQVASLHVAVGGLSHSFTTRNRLRAGESLHMSLVDGPFRSLGGEWTFQALGESGSKVTLSLSFEIASGLVSSAFGHGFARVADRLVRDFVTRADAVYGPIGSSPDA